MSRIPRITPLTSGCLLLSLLLVAGSVPSAVADPANHLIISEVVTQTRLVNGNRLGSEFIEVVNPTGADIDLSNVYLTDGTYGPNSVFYWNITTDEVNSETTGGGDFGDFHARFPAGFVIASLDTIAISVNGSTQYFEAYGQLPDLELYEDGNAPDEVPEMVAVFDGSIHGGDPIGETDTGLLPSLSDGSEGVVLYQWDGTSDLVADVDYAIWGTSTSVRFDKTGTVVGAGSYLADTAIALQDPISELEQGFGKAYARLSADEGTETLAGGNGVGGHDETSENMSTTWEISLTQNPPQMPGTMFPTVPIFASVIRDLPSPSDGTDVILTATVAAFNDDVTGVEFRYIVGGGAEVAVTGVADGSGNWDATVPGQAEGEVIQWYAVATNAAGGEAFYPAAAPRFMESWTVSPPPSGAEIPQKLLITEVSAGDNIFPTYLGNEIDMEFIEIHNPNTFAVDMSNYYITDAINYQFSTQLYWFIANGPPHTQSSVGGGNYNDFTARFPDGYIIKAGQTIVMAIGGSGGFESFFGSKPDIELYEDGAEADGIVDMRPVFENTGNNPPGNSIYTADRDLGNDGLGRGVPELEEHYGEPVILYHWNEGDNLVTDIDIFMFGAAKTGDFRIGFDKTGVSVGGSAYGDDKPVVDQDWFSSLDESGTVSYTRIDSDSDQTQTGGNGVGGQDETSEELNITFEVGPFSPGVYAAGVQISIPAVLRVPAKTFIPSRGEVFPIEFEGPLNSEIKLRLFDQQGRLVITLFDSRFDTFLAGITNYIRWDGLDDTYQRVRAGMYILHMSVVDMKTGAEQTKTVPVVLATRLSK